MLNIKAIHHIALICSNYDVSKKFYTEVLGFEVVREVFRAERNSYKLDLALHGTYIIEIFSFVDPPERPSRPEACGLRHLAFAVENIEATLTYLDSKGVNYEAVRIDAHTGKKFTFIADPDGQPLEFYEL